jgi:hypothetical protein
MSLDGWLQAHFPILSIVIHRQENVDISFVAETNDDERAVVSLQGGIAHHLHSLSRLAVRST